MEDFLIDHLELIQEAKKAKKKSKVVVNKRTGQKGRWVMIGGRPIF